MANSDPVTVLLGCDPYLQVRVVENSDNGGLFMFVENVEVTEDGTYKTTDGYDIDGLLFNMSDDFTGDLEIETSLDAELSIFPQVEKVDAGEGRFITDAQFAEDGVDTLADGTQVADSYDVGITLGTEAGSTAGDVGGAWMALFSEDGSPLTIDDLDLDSFAAVVDSDGEDGKVLLANPDATEAVFGDDETGEDEAGDDEDDPASVYFVVEGGVNVGVTLTETEEGGIEVSLKALGEDEGGTGEIGDLFGFFFDIEDESLLDDLSVSGADVTDAETGANDVTNMGKGNNVNGEVVNEAGAFDGGLSLGTPGAGRDDIQHTQFTLSHPDGLSLEDFAGQDVALRLTSVGEEDGDRSGSLKLLGKVPALEDDFDDDGDDCVSEYDLDDVMALMSRHTESDEDEDDEEMHVVDAFEAA